MELTVEGVFKLSRAGIEIIPHLENLLEGLEISVGDSSVFLQNILMLLLVLFKIPLNYLLTFNRTGLDNFTGFESKHGELVWVHHTDTVDFLCLLYSARLW